VGLLQNLCKATAGVEQVSGLPCNEVGMVHVTAGELCYKL
jgi:hypothetical protein